MEAHDEGGPAPYLVATVNNWMIACRLAQQARRERDADQVPDPIQNISRGRKRAADTQQHEDETALSRKARRCELVNIHLLRMNGPGRYFVQEDFFRIKCQRLIVQSLLYIFTYSLSYISHIVRSLPTERMLYIYELQGGE